MSGGQGGICHKDKERSRTFSLKTFTFLVTIVMTNLCTIKQPIIISIFYNQVVFQIVENTATNPINNIEFESQFKVAESRLAKNKEVLTALQWSNCFEEDEMCVAY